MCALFVHTIAILADAVKILKIFSIFLLLNRSRHNPSLTIVKYLYPVKRLYVTEYILIVYSRSSNDVNFLQLVLCKY